MAGRIKRGEGTLIGNAGEFYAAAELCRKGVIAALAPRNAPSFDIAATKKKKTVRIRVKTKSEEYTDWQWKAKEDGSIFRDLAGKNDFTVLVNLTKKTKDLEFLLFQQRLLTLGLSKILRNWLKPRGKTAGAATEETRNATFVILSTRNSWKNT